MNHSHENASIIFREQIDFLIRFDTSISCILKGRAGGGRAATRLAVGPSGMHSQA
jgi:hypothetical protein